MHLLFNNWKYFTPIIICLVLVAVLFGAKRIPDLARSIGKAKGEFKKGLLEGEKEEKEAEEAAKAETAKEIVADK